MWMRSKWLCSCRNIMVILSSMRRNRYLRRSWGIWYKSVGILWRGRSSRWIYRSWLILRSIWRVRRVCSKFTRRWFWYWSNSSLCLIKTGIYRTGRREGLRTCGWSNLRTVPRVQVYLYRAIYHLFLSKITD